MSLLARFLAAPVLIVLATVASSFYTDDNVPNKTGFSFPYRQAGLTDREAVAHLISRFTYGGTPGLVDEILARGPENWFAAQLEAKQNDEQLAKLLAGFDALAMNNETIVKTFPDAGTLLRMAMEEGEITREEAARLQEKDKKAYQARVMAYLAKKGMKPRAELILQLINQKVLRAAYSNNQLQEVMTSFWFNHFNVSVTKNECSRFVLAYERDVIRPNALGKFETLLLATAKSPAMLTFLDNARSMVDQSNQSARQMQRDRRAMEALDNRKTGMSEAEMAMINRVKNNRKNQGLNENYAREIMELHTMGVDGGYTQADVTGTARVLTGWTLYPMNGRGRQVYQQLTSRFSEAQLSSQGFKREGDFLFTANRHDYNAKKILGHDFEAGRGFEEGEALIHLLASHASTARFICTKLAARFVNDEPAATLVDKMAATFSKSNGDIKAVLITMTTSSEFWSAEAVTGKTKSPFELAISSVRAVNAEISRPYELFRWTTKMGEEFYHYQAPTGFPDRGNYWINAGSLLNRMNFGLAFANSQIPGLQFDLPALSQHHEPESTPAALRLYGNALMPQRNMEETVTRLLPLIQDPAIQEKIAAAAGKTNQPTGEEYETERGKEEQLTARKMDRSASGMAMQPTTLNQKMLAQVLGILIGSPEFQKR